MTGDHYDEALSAVREGIESIGTWTGIWVNRKEPDVHARRCAADAIDSIDAAIRSLHDVRARLVGEIRAADDATARRADELLRGERGVR